MLALLFLKRDPKHAVADMARYLVDEVLEVFAPNKSVAASAEGAAEDDSQSPEWKMLKSLRQRLEFDEAVFNSQAGDPDLRPAPKAALDPDLDLSALIAFSASLVQRFKA